MVNIHFFFSRCLCLCSLSSRSFSSVISSCCNPFTSFPKICRKKLFFSYGKKYSCEICLIFIGSDFSEQGFLQNEWTLIHREIQVMPGNYLKVIHISVEHNNSCYSLRRKYKSKTRKTEERTSWNQKPSKSCVLRHNAIIHSSPELNWICLNFIIPIWN